MKKLLINKAILEELFKENYKGLYYHAYSFTNDSDVSKDIVNDVFELIWKKRDNIDITYSIKSLLYSMTKNKAINYLRHEEVKKKYSDYKIDSSEMVEEDYRDHEALITKIKAAIEELPPQGRIIFKMCFIENRRYKEIAEELDLSVNTVKTHISKSLKRLRNDFSGEILLFFISTKK
ncbi:RNA polymerase sigma-70 factor [Ancylomarina euxinus]|uniref:RNA polymerase sigma-70 factor n=1 Tax=Ancylomarina euxinus TaxID=2283627 RepID=UPI0012E1C158|nr:RNA polymerase sigma-70 factor [Ancylomarina euxinus]MCZ4695580.1 RNA polymerase sigma-70 factor [Ancylomarina euxinus]